MVLAGSEANVRIEHSQLDSPALQHLLDTPAHPASSITSEAVYVEFCRCVALDVIALCTSDQAILYAQNEQRSASLLTKVRKRLLTTNMVGLF